MRAASVLRVSRFLGGAVTQSDRLTTRIEREALRSIRRACHAGLDSITLREQVARRAAPIVPTEACGLVTTDPETGLFTHGWMEGIPEGFTEEYVAEFYLDEVIDFLDRARSGRTTFTGCSTAYQGLLRAHGLEHRAHAVLCSDGQMWGSWCLFREPASPTFGEKELRFLRAIAPCVGYGMRLAAAMEKAVVSSASDSAPGVVVIDGRGRITLRSGPATAHLEDLTNVGIDTGALSYAVVSVLARLRAAHAAGEGPLAAEVRAQGRSGRWYVLRASLSEPDASGESARVIVIEPLGAREAPTSLSQLYALSPREREVLSLVLRGESTKRIAAQLGLSPYTVQDYLDQACEKVGVRGRKALLAKLASESTAPAADR
jgi:DNA-binding CsgD family transcriptional regulator